MGNTFPLRRVPLWRRWSVRPRTCIVQRKALATTCNGSRLAFLCVLTSPPISLTFAPRCGFWGYVTGRLLPSALWAGYRLTGTSGGCCRQRQWRSCRRPSWRECAAVHGLPCVGS